MSASHSGVSVLSSILIWTRILKSKIAEYKKTFSFENTGPSAAGIFKYSANDNTTTHLIFDHFISQLSKLQNMIILDLEANNVITASNWYSYSFTVLSVKGIPLHEPCMTF